MSRWLSAFFVLLALLGFGAALQATLAGAGTNDLVSTERVAQASPADIPSQPADTHERALAQAESEKAVDVSLLIDSSTSACRYLRAGAAPLQCGWAPVASPFIEGLQRPPRVMQSLA